VLSMLYRYQRCSTHNQSHVLSVQIRLVIRIGRQLLSHSNVDVGIISPLNHCRIGFQPLACYMPGNVGLIAKSGTLSYETVGALTRAGLGQSTCIGMGGDILAGTNMVEALQFFEHDEDTDGIILVGEVGGRAELDAADWITEYRKRCTSPK